MNHRFETLAVHAGQETPDPTTRSRAVPIYQGASFVFDDTQHAADLFALRTPGNIYGRIMNPTQDIFETRVNALEGGVGALATASGAAAVTYAVLNLATAGDNIVAMSTLYGGTYALFAHTLPQFGITTRFISPDRPEQLADQVDERTKLVFGETLSNPRLNVLDLDAWHLSASSLGLPLIVDNTVTPFLVRPFEYGADVVVHSATKYLGGHGAGIGGVIVDSGNFDWAKSPERFPGLTGPDAAYHGTVWTEAAERAAYIARARTVLLRNTGATMSPFNAWLFLQGIETLHLRMERHCENALAVAKWLSTHRGVAWVNYPGLDTDQYHTAASKYFTSGYGGLISFGLKSGKAGGSRFVEALKLFTHTANIGDTKSLAIHSASTTHSQLSDDELLAAGVAPEMVRLSIGIEHISDIIFDLDQAIASADAN